MTKNNELHEGDTVRAKRGKYRGKTGTIERIGSTTGSWIDIKPLYLVRIEQIGPLVYERDEIERVTEESRGVV